MNNIPNYFNYIIENRKYKHKDDNKNLELAEMELINEKNKKVRNFEGIIVKLPNLEEYRSTIINCINTKNQKYKLYNKSLNHINLIIYDNIKPMIKLENKDFYKYYFTNTLIDAITKSQFREIYLITQIKNGAYYYPLKLLYLISELYLLNGFIWNSNLYNNLKELNDLNISSNYFYKIGVEDFLIIFKKNEVKELIYSNYGIKITENNEIRIKDYNNNYFPKEVKKYNLNENLISDDFIIEYNNFKKNNTFETEIGNKIYT